MSKTDIQNLEEKIRRMTDRRLANLLGEIAKEASRRPNWDAIILLAKNDGKAVGISKNCQEVMDEWIAACHSDRSLMLFTRVAAGILAVNQGEQTASVVDSVVQAYLEEKVGL